MPKILTQKMVFCLEAALLLGSQEQIAPLQQEILPSFMACLRAQLKEI